MSLTWRVYEDTRGDRYPDAVLYGGGGLGDQGTTGGKGGIDGLFP